MFTPVRLVALLVALPLEPVGSDPVGARVEAIVTTPGYADAHWGLLVVDSATGRTVYERNADRIFAPASVTKLYSVAAALVELGPDHRFVTHVVRRGNVDREGVLRGDLILVASGDPVLGGRTGPGETLLFEDIDHIYAGGNDAATLVPADPLGGLDALARGLVASGVREIAGEVIVDDRLFEASPSTGSGPSRVAPVAVNENLVDVVVTPGSRPGEPAAVATVPRSAFVRFDAAVETVAEGRPVSVVVEPIGPRSFSVRGTIPAGRKGLVRIFDVAEPASFARALLIETLRRRGIAVSASPLGSNPGEALSSRAEVAALPVAASYTSPPFREYARVILKVSHNGLASTLPLLLAARNGERTLAEGLRREGRILERLGLDLRSVSFGGGAGGSRADLVTPRATVALLRAMAARPEGQAFASALPVLGIDGTLARAVGPESPARGHARAKTGTYWLDNDLTGRTVLTSKALAGTIDAADGRSLTVAFFLNNVPIDGQGGPAITEATAAAGRLLGRLCEVFYEGAPIPTPGTPSVDLVR